MQPASADGFAKPDYFGAGMFFFTQCELTFSVKAQAWKCLGYAIFRGSLTDLLRGKNTSAQKSLSDIYVNVPF